MLAWLLQLSPISLESDSAPLLVGTNGEYPPFSYVEKGEIVGFDIDIAKEVAKRLKKDIVLSDMPFEALIPALTLGKVQVGAAGLNPTEERAKRVLFTKSYYIDPLVVVAVGKRLTIDELKGKSAIVNEGYMPDLYLSKIPAIELIRLPAPAEAFVALRQKRADAFVTTCSTVATYLATAKDPLPLQCTVIENVVEDTALAISMRYPDLLPEIQRALDDMRQDGTMAAIKAKWKLVCD